MKKQIKSDLALKVFSVIIAIVLWIYVVQVENPDIDRTVKDVPVVFTQKGVLEERDLILLNDNAYTVDVEIRGARQYVMDASKENITVLADVSNITSTGLQHVVTNIVLPYANLELLNQNPATLTVDVDDLVSVKKPVEVLTEGNPKDSYVVGNLTADPKEVTVFGPKTIVNGIHAVAAIVDVSGKTADTAGMEPIQVLDSNNKPINSQLLTFSEDIIEVHAEILKSRAVELELVFAESAQSLANDYILDENSIKKIKIAGVQALVDNMEHVPTKAITMYDIRENGEVTVELDLPQGVRSLDGDSFTLRFSRRMPEAHVTE